MQIIIASQYYPREDLIKKEIGVPTSSVFRGYEITKSEDLFIQITLSYLSNYNILMNGQYLQCFSKLSEAFRAIREYSVEIANDLQRRFETNLPSDLRQMEQRLHQFRKDFKEYPITYVER